MCNIMESLAVDFAVDFVGDDDEADFETAQKMFRGWMAESLSYCNRSDIPEAMISIVRDITIAAYNRRGDEGATSSSVGGQSMSYEDLGKAMRSRLLGAGLRVYRI